jgi:tetratricopeptide (TPR) repeat protein
MRRKALVWVIPFFFLVERGFPQSLSQAGDALQSMNAQAGAKASALGGAFSALADDPSAVYWNPAGLGWIKNSEIQTTYNQWFQDTFFQDLGAVFPTDWGAVGARLSYVNFGSFQDRDAFGNPLGPETPQAFAAALASSFRFGDFGLGLSAKADNESYTGYSVGGFGVDAGALYRQKWGSFSAGLRNLGAASSFSLPTEFYLGAEAGFGPPDSRFRLATDVTFPSGPAVFHHGLEWAYDQKLFIRVGYEWVTQSFQYQDQAGFGGGMGLKIGQFDLDYSLVSYGDLGLTNKAALAYEFDDGKPEAPIKTASVTVKKKAATATSPMPVPTEAPIVKVSSEPSPPAQAPASLDMRQTYKRGIAAYQKEDYETALALLRQATAIQDPSIEKFYYAEAYAMLGVIEQYHSTAPGHLKAAKSDYRAALKWEPGNETAAKHLKQLK